MATATLDRPKTEIISPTQEKAIKLWADIAETMEVAAKAGSHILCFGPPGTGKTTSAYTLASRLSLSFIKETLHPDMSAQELRGHYVPVGGNAWEYKLMPVGRGFAVGAVVALDEIDQAIAGVRTVLYGILDDPTVARLYIPSHTIVDGHHYEESVPRHERFIAVATTNQTMETLDLPGALMDRLPVRLNVYLPNPEAVARIQSPALRRIVWEVYTPGDRFNGKLTFRQLKAVDNLLSNGLGVELATRAVFPDEKLAVMVGTAISMVERG